MELTHEEAHELARAKGSNPVLYFLLRMILVPVMKVFFGLQARGVQNLPRTGPVAVSETHLTLPTTPYE